MHSRVYPKVIEGTQCTLLFKRKNIYCIGNRSSRNFIKLYPEQKKDAEIALHMMNGKSSLEDIMSVLPDFDVYNFYIALCNCGLIAGKDSNIKKNEYEIYSLKIASFQLTENYFERYILKKFLLKKYFYLLTLLLLLATAYSARSIPNILMNPNCYRIFHSDSLNLLIYYVVSVSSVLLHELGHKIIAIKYGIFPKKLVIALYLYISPIIYLEMPGIYAISQWKRIKVWGAGIYVNYVLCSVAAFLYRLTSYNLLGLIFTINLTLILINIIPFMLLDGYYIFSTLIEETDLRLQFLNIWNINVWRKSNSWVRVYIVVSFVLILLYLSTQAIWISEYISSALRNSGSISQTIYNLRLLVILFVLIIIGKVVRYGVKNNAIRMQKRK